MLVMAVIIGRGAVELGERVAIPDGHGVISSAEAVVGHPLTPVSVAGTARRTVRPCAAGVYSC
jgi:hypothetical protein